MGGVATDLHARTTLPGLYAAGECAATGVHGANRLASNSLLEGLVFGARAAEAMAEDSHAEPADVDGTSGPGPTSAGSAKALRAELRRRTWQHLGLERDASGLRDLLAWLAPLREGDRRPADREEAELRNLVDVAWTMAASAQFREESRGGHYRTDFPAPDDRRFHGHTLLDGGRPRLADVEMPLGASVS
jgi:L-aspartate oxidase